jgi:secondary thiamine-phosphate synthase enzyme
MPHYQKALNVRTVGKSLQNITRSIASAVADSGIQVGICHLFLRHTSASLTIQENADPDVLEDLANFFS